MSRRRNRSQRCIGIPGYRALLNSIEEASTQEQAVALLFASDVITMQEKQLFLDAHMALALQSSPLRQMLEVRV